ncbi:MAG: hypothetical protein OHK93_008775 [Ramalina farinacea]|uniref:Uncharacterized protein n=1 Tax=Ramalina farinacea TaxID=258253 RepID=A0AA43TS65_9LECA|nr:hypothetical protein [Ramalina farinacea]
MLATRPSALSQSDIRDPSSSSLSSLALSSAPSALTFFPTLLTPPCSPPLESQAQPSDEGPITDSASRIPSSTPPASSMRHDPPPLTLPEPSPPLTPPPQASLSAQINLATRPVHTRLNRRILGLLPLALPPHAETPELYVQGMEAVRDIYGALEGTVRRAREDCSGVNDSSDKTGRNSRDDCSADFNERISSHRNPGCNLDRQDEEGVLGKPRVDLNGLDLTGLLGRATRLENDLLELKRRIASTDLRFPDSPFSNNPSPTNTASADITSQPYPTQKDQPRGAKQKPPALAALTHRIHSLSSSEVGTQHQHLLLAPLHQFTLALFNGGRHIRRRLLSTSSSFWSPPPACHSSTPASSILPAPSPFTLATTSHPSPLFTIQEVHQEDEDGGTADNVLTFWHIPDRDEEDVKSGFKRTFELVAAGLASWERDEVVAEAVSVMQMLECVVEEIVMDVEMGAKFEG